MAGERTVRVTWPVHICAGRNRILPLMRRQNTDSPPNKPVTWPRNQLLKRYAVTSLVHTHDTGLRYAVTLQVWTRLKGALYTYGAFYRVSREDKDLISGECSLGQTIPI